MLLFAMTPTFSPTLSPTYASTFGVVRCRLPPVSMGWADAQRRRKEQEHAAFLAREAAKAERAASEEQARQEADAFKRVRDEELRQAAEQYQDSVDFYRPGGVLRQPTASAGLTKADFENAQRLTPSRAMAAEEALQRAADDVSSLPPAEAVALLQRLIDEAASCGVVESAPPRRKATQLLGALQTAADAEVKRGDTAPDALSEQMRSIFAEEFPVLEDDDVV